LVRVYTTQEYLNWVEAATWRRPPVQSEDQFTMATATDPVCGMQVDTETAQYTAVHEGQTYYFCSKGCMLEFRDDPQRFLDPEYVPHGM
jgi:YHS domain-containing protein